MTWKQVVYIRKFACFNSREDKMGWCYEWSWQEAQEGCGGEGRRSEEVSLQGRLDLFFTSFFLFNTNEKVPHKNDGM